MKIIDGRGLLVRWTLAAGALLTLLEVASASAETGWTIEDVASYEARIAVPQVVADAGGAIHIVSYANLVMGPWRYFTNASGTFVQESVATLSDAWGGDLVLTVDGSGAVGVLGEVPGDTFGDQHPGVARRVNGSFVVSGVPVDIYMQPGTNHLLAAAFDRGGELHVVTALRCDIGHAVGLPGGAFESNSVVSGCGKFVSHVAVAVAPDGQVHIAWLANEGKALGEVRYAVGSGATWAVSRIAKVGKNTSAWAQALDLAVDSRGRPQIIYFDSRDPKPRVTYATRRGRRWQKQSLGNLTAYPSIAVGPDDKVHVVYDAPFPGRSKLYYAQLRGGRWRKEVITPLASDTPTDVFVDAAGVVHVAFYDQVAGTLRYGRRSP